MNIKQYCLLVTGFCMVFGNPLFAIEYDDDLVLEPYPLTKELVQELTQKDSSKTIVGSHVVKGISLSVRNYYNSSFILDLKVDPRLNLWRGNPRSMESGHMGKLEVIISAVTDKNGENIYDGSRDINFITKNKNYEAPVYHLKDNSFTGVREINFNKKSDDLYPTEIAGTIKLSLPINIKKHEIKVDSPETIKPLTDRDDIDNVKLNNGIHISHPRSMPEFPICIMGFNKANQFLKIGASGSAGVEKDNHWYNYERDSGFDRALLFIPDEIIDIEIPFSLTIKDSRTE